MLENESSPVVDDKNYLNPNNVGRNNMMEKKNVDENYYAKPEMKFTNSEAVDDQFIDAASIFPRSYSLYRLGIPPPE